MSRNPFFITMVLMTAATVVFLYVRSNQHPKPEVVGFKENIADKEPAFASRFKRRTFITTSSSYEAAEITGDVTVPKCTGKPEMQAYTSWDDNPRTDLRAVYDVTRCPDDTVFPADTHFLIGTHEQTREVSPI